MRRGLYAALAVTVAAAVVLAVLYATAPPATPVKVGDRAPTLSLPTISGDTPVPIPGLGQAPLVLVIFDLRSPSATLQLADLERLHRRYWRRGLKVVGVSLDAELAPLRAAVEKSEASFPILRAPGGVALQGSYGVPAEFLAYVIAPTGVVEGIYRGPFDWRATEMRARLEAHLLPPPPGW